MAKGVCAVSVSPAIDRTIYVNNFQLDKVNRVKSSFDIPGSKGVNIAKNLAVCGIKSTCAGFIGGAGTDFIKAALSESGVICDFVPVSYDVRTNLKIVDLDKKTYTDVNFPSGEPAEEEISLLTEKIKALACKNEFIALSGNLTSPALSNLYSRIIDKINPKTAKITVDCSGEALRLAVKKKPYAIKPNLIEFNETFSLNCKKADDIKNAALKLFYSGIENILVSMDKDGAVAVCSGKAYFVSNCDLPVYNTVGAGDAFLSGFIYAKLNNYDDITALKCASSFAQATVSHKAEDLLSLEKYKKHIGDIKVVELN